MKTFYAISYASAGADRWYLTGNDNGTREIQGAEQYPHLVAVSKALANMTWLHGLIGMTIVKATEGPSTPIVKIASKTVVDMTKPVVIGGRGSSYQGPVGSVLDLPNARIFNDGSDALEYLVQRSLDAHDSRLKARTPIRLYNVETITVPGERTLLVMS